MNKRQFSLLVLTSLTLSATPVWADEYDDTIANFRKADESGRYFANAYGYAVFPTRSERAGSASAAPMARAVCTNRASTSAARR